MSRDDLAELLATHESADAEESEDLERMRGFASSLDEPFSRDQPEAHFTASAIVVDEAGERTLLVHHRKSGSWFQSGGHLQPGDRSAGDAALREAAEETGLTVRLARPELLDVDVHWVPWDEHYHLDLRFHVIASGELATDAAEVHAAAWLAWDAALARAPEHALAARSRRSGRLPADSATSVRRMEEEVEIRRSRRARRWRLTVPWGGPVRLTVPYRMTHGSVTAVLDAHREWIARERARQVPRLALDERLVSERAARRAARELVTSIVEDEAAALGVSYSRIEIRGQRTRWGSCSTRATLSFNWRLVLAPVEVLDYVVVHEVCHLREPNHSPRFWRLVAERRPDWRCHRDWLRDHGAELLAFRPEA